MKLVRKAGARARSALAPSFSLLPHLCGLLATSILARSLDVARPGNLWGSVLANPTFDCTNCHALAQIVASLTHSNIAEREDAVYSLQEYRKRNTKLTSREQGKTTVVRNLLQQFEEARKTKEKRKKETEQSQPRCSRSQGREVVIDDAGIAKNTVTRNFAMMCKLE